MSVDAYADPPTYRIRFTEDAHAVAANDSTAVHLDSSYVVDDTPISRAFGSALPPELADLVDIALAVYVSDRISRRRPHGADRSVLNWTRRFELTIPIRECHRWQDEELSQMLRDVLWFLTEDDWRIHFVERRRIYRPAESQHGLFPMPPEPPVTVALFSGGLDSLAGLYCEIATYSEGSIVLLSVTTNRQANASRRQLVHGVRERTGRDIIPVDVPITLHRDGRRYHNDESTQRSRGFLFGVLGAVTAIMAGTDSIASYENGIGAINLPYTPAQLGTHSTRSSHPTALMQLGALVRKATGRRFAFRSPFLYMTKGQLCARASEYGLGEDVGATVSCDSFPLRLARTPQCGTCTSCLLRRQSLYAAGLDWFDWPDRYAIDVVCRDQPIRVDKLRPLRMMLSQVDTLRHALWDPKPWRQITKTYPQLWEVSVDLQSCGQDRELVHRGLMDLYRRYCDEWELFPVRPAPVEVVAERAVG